jgi:membrane protein YqaA with SNARE-associated domain
MTASGLGVASAVFPWFNAEVVLLSAVATVSSTSQLLLVVIGVTVGQVAGKSLMYWGARRVSVQPTPRLQGLLNRWRDRMASRPRSAPAMIFVSAAVGFPPPYLVTIAAGTLGVSFWPFLAATGIGRLLHFGLLALVPAVYWLR